MGNEDDMKKLEISWNGAKTNIKLKAMLYGEYNECLRKAMKITMRGSTPNAEIDSTALEESVIFKTIAEAPFTISIDNVRLLTIPDAKEIYRRANILSGLTEDKRDFLEVSPGDTPSAI
jgi:hypothetical protein